MSNNILTEQSVQKQKRIPLNVRFSQLFKHYVYLKFVDLKNFIDSKMKLWYSKKAIAYFSIITYLILYNESFRKLYESLIVKTILESLTSDWQKDIFFICLFIYLTFYFIVLFLRSFKLNTDFVIIFSLITIQYSIYRCCNNYWIFYDFYYSPIKKYPNIIFSIKYADIIFIIEFYIILIYIKSFFKKTKQITESTFLVDEPIEEDGDSLNREKPAEELAKMIAGIKNENNSFAIGIIAPWGSGKTSFLNLIKKHLENKDKILIHYNPWYNNTPQAIIQDFFEVLKNTVKPFSSQLSNEIFTYANKLSELNSSNASKIFKELVSTIDDKGTVEEQYERINKGLKSINKQIVIFIDDIDRLEKKEIVEVIRLIRNTANFSNVVFVVAYDKNYVVNSLEPNYNSDFFLEKIFQFEFNLPLIQPEILLNKIKELLSEALPNSKTIIEKSLETFENIDSFPKLNMSSMTYEEYIDKSLFKEFIKNLRDVYRFCNLFIFKYKFVEGEVDFLDFFYLHLIEIKYPKLYDWLKDTHLLVLGLPNVDESLFNNTLISYKNASTHLMKICNELYDKSNSKRSITQPSNYLLYFKFQLENRISLVEVTKLRKEKNIDKIQEKIKEWNNKGIIKEFVDILYDINDFDNREDFEFVVKTIFYLYIFLQEKELEENLSIIWRKMNYLLKDDFDSIKNKYYPNEEDKLKNFINTLFKDTKNNFYYVFFLQNFLYQYLIKEDFSFILSKDEIQMYLIDYLKSYLSKIDSLDKISEKIYERCWDRIEDERYILMDEANRVYFDYINKFSINYIKLLIRPNSNDPREKYYVLNPFIPQTFRSYDEFETFLSSLNNDESQEIKEVKEFYEKYKKNNYQPIPFERH